MTQATVTIERIAYGGKGVVRVDGKVWFIPGTVPGDRVEAKITNDHERYADAEVIAWVEKSAERTESPCRFSDECGGCGWLDIPYERQLEWKKSFIKSGLQRIGRVDADEDIPIHGSEQILHYRNRILLRAYGTGDGLDVGYFRRASRDLVTIDRCAIAEPRLNDLIAALDGFKGHPGSKWRLECQVIAGGQVTITVYPGDRDTKGSDELVAALRAIPFVAWAGLVFDLKEAPLLRLEEDRDIVFHTFPGQFQQINTALNHKLRDIVAKIVKEREPKRVLDVFCGSGNLSLVVAAPERYVEAIEVNRKAIVVGHRNAEHNKLDVTFLAGDAEAHLWKCDRGGESFDLVILDPPRQGMYKGMIPLKNIAPQTILYVSCDPNTLARDVGALTKKGRYKLVQLEALDFFPNTYHVETVAVLERS